MLRGVAVFCSAETLVNAITVSRRARSQKVKLKSPIFDLGARLPFRFLDDLNPPSPFETLGPASATGAVPKFPGSFFDSAQVHGAGESRLVRDLPAPFDSPWHAQVYPSYLIPEVFPSAGRGPGAIGEGSDENALSKGASIEDSAKSQLSAGPFDVNGEGGMLVPGDATWPGGKKFVPFLDSRSASLEADEAGGGRGGVGGVEGNMVVAPADTTPIRGSGLAPVVGTGNEMGN